MPTDCKTPIKYEMYKLIYESIEYIDIWMGYMLDDDHHISIRKHGYQYHVNLYHNNNSVDEKTITYPCDPNGNIWVALLLNMMNMCFKILKWWLIYVGIWYYMKN